MPTSYVLTRGCDRDHQVTHMRVAILQDDASHLGNLCLPSVDIASHKWPWLLHIRLAAGVAIMCTVLAAVRLTAIGLLMSCAGNDVIKDEGGNK